MFLSYLWPFLIYASICFGVSFMLIEYGQKYLYDEMPSYTALRAVGGGLILGGVLTATHSSFDTMFTEKILLTLLLPIAFAGVFILLYRFQPIHGAAFALAAVLVLPGIATLAVDSLLQPRPASRDTVESAAEKRKKLRQPTGTAMPPPVEKLSP